METQVERVLYAASDDNYHQAVDVLTDLAAMTTWLADHLDAMPDVAMSNQLTGGVMVHCATRDDLFAVWEWLTEGQTGRQDMSRRTVKMHSIVTRSFGRFTIEGWFTNA